jgi:hypothetical protein
MPRTVKTAKTPKTTLAQAQDDGIGETGQLGFVSNAAIFETSMAMAGYAGAPPGPSAALAGDSLAINAAVVLTQKLAAVPLAAPVAAAESVARTSALGGKVGGTEAVVIGNAPDNGGGVIVSASSPQVTDDSSVNALAVNTAATQYLAATGVALNGAGEKIGILSDSFNLNGGEAAAIANGDLPAASQIHILEEGSAGNDEGQALAELIHSIAPAAQIYFYSGTSSEADMAAGINTLAGMGMNVIIDDITYTDEPFYQDTGVVTQAAEAAVADGISYFTSAGNSSDNFYASKMFAPMSFTLPGIGTRTVQDVGNGSPYEAVTLAAAATLDFTMEWDQPFGANQYALGVALFRRDSTTGAYSLIQSFQPNSLNGNPVNSEYANENVTAGTYYFAFYESFSNTVNGAPVTPGAFKIIFWPGSQVVLDGPDAGVGSGTSIGHELAPGVNTIGAVNVAQTPSQGVAVPVTEPYSSAGPGLTFLNAAGQLITPPIDDLTPNFDATDGSPTTIFDPFNGTSAAAANAAAVGLLVLQADPGLKPAELTYLLMRSAIPTADSTTGGAGLIQADVAVADALLAKTNPVWTGQGGSALWNTVANWSDGKAPAAGQTVRIVDGIGMLSGAYEVDFNLTSQRLAGLIVDGKSFTGAKPDLVIGLAETLKTATLTLGLATIDAAGSLIDTGALVGGSAVGMVEIEQHGHLTVAGAVGAMDVQFNASTGRVDFASTVTANLVAGLGGVQVSGFSGGDVMDFSGIKSGQVVAIEESGNVYSLLNSSYATLAKISITGAFSGLGFAADGQGGSEIVATRIVGDARVAGSGNATLTAASGMQNFAIGAGGAETVSGSAAASTVNRFMFMPNAASAPGGMDEIIGFRYGRDQIVLNPTGAAVSVAGFDAYAGPGGGTVLHLNDGTVIRLVGVALTAAQERTIASAGAMA